MNKNNKAPNQSPESPNHSIPDSPIHRPTASPHDRPTASQSDRPAASPIHSPTASPNPGLTESQHHCSTAITAALEAGKRIMEIYENESFDVDFKSDDSPLTKADLASHNIIMQHLKHTDIPVLSEEGKHLSYDIRKDWNQLWIVDPIDGTKEFIKRNGEFTVNIALIESQKPILGVIFVPASGELYFSTVEMGAYKTTVNLEGYNIEALLNSAKQLPLERDDKTFTIVASRSHMSPETETYVAEMRQKHGAVNLISKGSSLKLCMVAEGQADCYPRFAPTMEWDTAAGQAICEHAGFEVIDWETKKAMRYNREELLNAWFLVR